ncbi:MAG: GNAT family N-acetyltransferase [bacterium]|nr:GNAT family N-acetyltransferase [bacterium]
MNLGILDEQVTKLIEYSNNDPDVNKFTSDSERFRDHAAYERWRSQGRTVYTLVGGKDELYGIIWFGKKSLPGAVFSGKFDPGNYTITFAIRIYGDARGKGLAKPFMRNVFNHFSPKQGVWLETSGDNIAAVRAYTNFGFRKITNPNRDGKILMVLPKGVTIDK